MTDIKLRIRDAKTYGPVMSRVYVTTDVDGEDWRGGVVLANQMTNEIGETRFRIEDPDERVMLRVRSFKWEGESTSYKTYEWVGPAYELIGMYQMLQPDLARVESKTRLFEFLFGSWGTPIDRFFEKFYS